MKIDSSNLVFPSEKARYTPSPQNWTDTSSEQFMEWMKVSPLIPMHKLYGRITEPLQGDYTLLIDNSTIML